MAGRGRGRGRGSGFSFNTDGLGLGRSDILEISRTPKNLSALYPPLPFKVLPIEEDKNLEEAEEIGYLLAQKKLNYVVKPVKQVQIDVQRYSDKYYRDARIAENFEFSKMPVELRPVNVKKRKRVQISGENADHVEKRLKELEEQENKTENEPSDEEKEDAEEEIPMEEEEEELEEPEEGTDYTSSYFDNGEVDDEEDNLDDDGPIYS